jgi:hypothetical protein
VSIYATPDGDWTTDESFAVKNKKGEPQKYKEKGR